jgi:hypothetical protein
MTGIGAITNNMREAQQFAFLFTFMNFIPFYMMTSIVGRPDSGVAIGLSMFPPMGAGDHDAAAVGAFLGRAALADRALDRAAGRRRMARAHHLGAPVPDRPC